MTETALEIPGQRHYYSAWIARSRIDIWQCRCDSYYERVDRVESNTCGREEKKIQELGKGYVGWRGHGMTE